jgi:ESCRT-II complex subunit VPS36
MLYSIGVDLDQIDKIETSVPLSSRYLIQAGFLKSSPKITLHFKLQNQSTTPTTTKPSSPPQRNWICSYCTFSNPYPSNYTSSSPIPPCLNCGMPPVPGILSPGAPAPIQSPRPSPARLSPPVPPPRQTLQVAADGLFPCPRCTFHNHPALTACEICGEPLISPNLPPILASAEAIDRGVSPAPIPILGGEERNYVRLSFRSGGEKVFLERLKSAISKKAWEVRTW